MKGEREEDEALGVLGSDVVGVSEGEGRGIWSRSEGVWGAVGGEEECEAKKDSRVSSLDFSACIRRICSLVRIK